MRIINSLNSLRNTLSNLKGSGKTIGFVPTMGALHEGHLSLLRKCRRENNIVVLSIFVNPKQFGPNEDFSRYPRPEKKDEILAKKENVDIIFHPSEKTMYPRSFLTEIKVDRMTDTLCGKLRPGHFTGVTTVVGKLLNIVQPDKMYLGQKDAQQVAVIKQMVRDLNFPTVIRVGKTIREKDGLALSSRNAYLGPTERREAAQIYRTLKLAREEILNGETSARKIEGLMRKQLQRLTSATVQYAQCVDPDNLEAKTKLKGKIMLATALNFKNARLIDNLIFSA